MLVKSILEAVSSLGQPNQAIQYLTKLINQLNSDPIAIQKLGKTKRDKVAHIITGLHVISTPQFRQSLKISDNQYNQIVTQMLTNSVAANYVYTAGKRLPSMAKVYVDRLDRLHLMNQQQKQEMATDLKKIYIKLTEADKTVSKPQTSTQQPQSSTQQQTAAPPQKT